MRIGKLDRQIDFQRSTATRSDTGQTTFTYADYVKGVWAWIMSKDGSEFNEANKQVQKHYWIVKVRYRADIKETDRIIYDGKTLNITSVSHDSSRSDFTEYLCSETPAQ